MNMTADQLIRNADLLLVTMRTHVDDLLAVLPSREERVRLRDGVAALEPHARAVQTIGDVLAVADAITKLVLSFPALQTHFLPDCIYRDALPDMLQDGSITRQHDYIAKHKPGMINAMADLKQQLDEAVQRELPPPPRPSWWQRLTGRGAQ